MKKLTFAHDIFSKPPTNKILDAYTTLNHYCQVNYLVPVSKLRPLIHRRFTPTTIEHPKNGEQHAVISAVVFQEKNFHYTNMKWLGSFNFSQTNYRTYVVD